MSAGKMNSFNLTLPILALMLAVSAHSQNTSAEESIALEFDKIDFLLGNTAIREPPKRVGALFECSKTCKDIDCLNCYCSYGLCDICTKEACARCSESLCVACYSGTFYKCAGKTFNVTTGCEIESNSKFCNGNKVKYTFPLNTRQIVGIALGAAAATILLIAILVSCCREMMHKNKHSQQDQPLSTSDKDLVTNTHIKTEEKI